MNCWGELLAVSAHSAVAMTAHNRKQAVAQLEPQQQSLEM